MTLKHILLLHVIFKFIKCFKHNFKILVVIFFQNLYFQKDMQLTVS